MANGDERAFDVNPGDGSAPRVADVEADEGLGLPAAVTAWR